MACVMGKRLVELLVEERRGAAVGEVSIDVGISFHQVDQLLAPEGRQLFPRHTGNILVLDRIGMPEMGEVDL